MGGSQKVVLPNLSVSASKTSAHSSSTLSSPCLAHTIQVVSSSLCNSAAQPSAPTLHDNVCIPERAICVRWVCPPLCPSGCVGYLRPRRASAATFLRIAYVWPQARKGVPVLRLGVAALPYIVAVLPLVEPKHVAASLRRFSRFLVESVEIARSCAISGTSWRRKGEVSMPIPWHVGPPNLRNRGRGRQEGTGIWTVWMQMCRSFASCQDCACIGVLGIASERPQLYTLLVGSQNVDPEDGACTKPEVGRSPLYGPLPSLLFVCVCLGGPDPDTRDPACCRVRVPGDEYRALRPVGQDKTSIEARGQVLSLRGGRLDHKQTLFLWQIREGNQSQGLRHHLFGRVRREVSPAASVQRDFDASAAPGLYIGMQEGASQMLVRAVDIVGQMATNGFANLARLEVRYDLVVRHRSDRVPGFACAHPCADMVPNAAGIHQHRGHVCSHGGGQVALLAKSFGIA